MSQINKGLLAFIVGLMAVWLLTACDRKTVFQNAAKTTAEAEYQCNKVKILKHTDSMVKLDVCGITRWYRCSIGKGQVKCREIKRKKNIEEKVVKWKKRSLECNALLKQCDKTFDGCMERFMAFRKSLGLPVMKKKNGRWKLEK